MYVWLKSNVNKGVFGCELKYVVFILWSVNVQLINGELNNFLLKSADLFDDLKINYVVNLSHNSSSHGHHISNKNPINLSNGSFGNYSLLSIYVFISLTIIELSLENDFKIPTSEYWCTAAIISIKLLLFISDGFLISNFCGAFIWKFIESIILSREVPDSNNFLKCFTTKLCNDIYYFVNI